MRAKAAGLFSVVARPRAQTQRNESKAARITCDKFGMTSGFLALKKSSVIY